MTNPTPTARPPARFGRTPARLAGTRRGRWTIVAIFGLGFAVLVGLYLSPRSRAPAVPPGLAAGWPDRPLTFVVVDGGPVGPRPQRLAEVVLAAAGTTDAAGTAAAAGGGAGGGASSPDVVMLVGIEAAVVPATAELLRMQASFHPQLYQRVRPGPAAAAAGPAAGVCVLSRFPLYAGAPVADGGRTVGATATAAVDGRRFDVTCLDARGGRVPPAAAGGGPPAGVVGGAADAGLFAGLAGTANLGPAGATVPAADARPVEIGPADTRPAGARFTVVRRTADPPVLVFTVGPAAGPAPLPR